ncbi:hypothetical protein [Sorangium sp. So ce341]|uniref:hypothetical protein n=1 Tax=Sorangium sp. So ce341 TaxID=3133302 RepID=UPI003F5F82F8
MRAAEIWEQGSAEARVALETRNAAAVGEEKQGLARAPAELAQEARELVLAELARRPARPSGAARASPRLTP